MSDSTMRAYNRARYLSQRDAVIERTRRREIENPWGVLKSRISAYAKKPTRTNIYRVVHAALRAGFLVRPDSCSVCGGVSETRDGRSGLHAHHPDHSKPLMVEWLCAKCHARKDDQKWTPVECPDCGKEIRGMSALAAHRRYSHHAA